MKVQALHDWSVTPKEAVQLQKDLRDQIKLKPFKKSVRLIAGADISFNKYSPTVYAGFVVLDGKTMEIVETASAVVNVTFPYIPGLLSFREIPPLIEAYKKLKTAPDVIVFDGHGIAHPRRFGIASHMGLLIDKPTIGCAKSLLTGVFEEPDPSAGSKSLLVDRHRHDQIGVVYRTKNKVKPIFISPGHNMDFESAVRVVASTVRGYRVPEPTRQAHLLVNSVRQAA